MRECGPINSIKIKCSVLMNFFVTEFSDKTGTLTEGRMTAVKIWVCEHKQAISVTGRGIEPVGDFVVPAEKVKSKKQIATNVGKIEEDSEKEQDEHMTPVRAT